MQKEGRIPTSAEWEWDENEYCPAHEFLDYQYARENFSGKDLDEILPLFLDRPLAAASYLWAMPAIPFRYYVLIYKKLFQDREIVAKLKESRQADLAAGSFLRLMKWKLEASPRAIIPVIKELMPLAEYVVATLKVADTLGELRSLYETRKALGSGDKLMDPTEQFKSDDIWSIGLEGWTLMDGNYPHFVVGQTRQFALEFYPTDLARSDSSEKMAERINLDTYRINGIVEYVDKDVWVLDFGVRAYRQGFSELPPEFGSPENGRDYGEFSSTLSVGQTLKGTINLLVDYYAYMEFLCKKPNMIPLIYTWGVDAIHIKTGLRSQDNGWIVDESTVKWHQAYATYERVSQRTGFNVLTCTLIDVPPTADGEPLATWDHPEIWRKMKVMSLQELQNLVRFYDETISKLENLVEAAISNSTGLNDDLKSVKDLFKDLGSEKTAHDLALPEEWIETGDWTADDYLESSKSLREKAFEQIAKLLKEQT